MAVGLTALVAVLTSLPCAFAEETTRERPETHVDIIASHVEAVTFYSTVLRTQKTFCAVLPASYAHDGGPWSVLFLIHGRGRHERSLIDDPVAREALLAAPFVTILPDGDDGWYINSPVMTADRYQDYMDEVVAAATAHYNLSTRREARGLSGWSMGGYGCTRYAIANHEHFGALAPIIGLLDFPRTGLPADQSYDVPRERFGDDAAVWGTFNPLNQAETLRGMALCLITGSTAFDRTMNLNFSRQLAALEIPHTLHVLEGGHTFDVVRASVPRVIAFMTKSLVPD